MSGPKTARYVLTEAQRRRIEERERIIRETKIERDKQNDLQKRCSGQLSEIASVIEDLRRLCMESDMGIEELQILETKKSELAKLFSVTNALDSLESLKKDNRRLETIWGQMQELNIN